MENIGAKLVRQAAAKTNDLAGDGTTTSVVLAQGLIAEGVKVCSSLKHNSTSINVAKTIVLLHAITILLQNCIVVHVCIIQD